MAGTIRSTGLRMIFSFFLGLMLTAFIGIGVYTFHPMPDPYDGEIREIDRQQRTLRNARPSPELTIEEREQIQELQNRRTELIEAAQEARKPWAMSTSIILIIFATIVMAASLVRADQLPVINNGLLLGGVFTMLYGVGWVVATHASILRFLVMTAALVITLGLGYARFVRNAPAAPASAGGELPPGGDVPQLERRVRDLEQRMDEAAQVLGQPRDR